MTDLFDEVESLQAEENAVEVRSAGGDLFDEVQSISGQAIPGFEAAPKRTTIGEAPQISEFPEEREETRAVQDLPELGKGGLLSSENPTKIAALTPVLLATTSNQEIANILQSNFENIGISQDPGGNIMATNNATGAQVVINKPGLSRLDVLQGLGIASAFTPAGRVAGAATGLGAKVATGAAASGLTQAAIEGIQTAAGGELDADEIAIATALGGAVETVLPAIQGLRQARAARQAGAVAEEVAQVAPATQVAEEAIEATGVPLFQAQKTLVPSQLEKQSFIASLPAGTLKASRELKAQNRAAGQAVDDFLGSIAPPESLVTGAEKFRSASQRALGRAKEIRAEKTSPLFNEAFESGAKVDTSTIRDTIKTTLGDFPEGGEVAKTLGQVAKLLGPKKEGEALTLKQLQNVKLELDQLINKVGSDSLGNTTKRELVQVKSQLLDQMDQASPLFKRARETFARESAPIGQLEDSLIGKIAAIDDTQLKNISKRMFDPAETNPAIVAKAKQVISDVDPDAWSQLVRVELERRLGSIKPVEGEALQNIPGQLHRAIFGNDKQTKVLFRALDGEQAKNLKYLQTILGRARLGRPGGSQTAAREEIKKELAGGAINSINNFLKQGLKTITLTGAEGVASNRRIRALAEVMFDPQWAPRMKELRGLKSDSPAAARAMAQLLKDATPDQEQE